MYYSTVVVYQNSINNTYMYTLAGQKYWNVIKYVV